MVVVDNRMNIHKVSKTFNIPYSSLQEWYYGQQMSTKRSRKGVLSLEEEEMLVQWLIRMCKMEHGVSLSHSFKNLHL